MNSIKAIFFLMFFLLLQVFLPAQNIVTDTGKIEMVQDHKVKALLEKHLEINSKAPIKGDRKSVV